MAICCNLLQFIARIFSLCFSKYLRAVIESAWYPGRACADLNKNLRGLSIKPAQILEETCADPEGKEGKYQSQSEFSLNLK